MSFQGWQTVEIAGRSADVFEPAERSEEAVALLYLHGHSERTIRDNPVFTDALERHSLPTVCPQGRRSWWLDIVCEEFDASVTPMDYLRTSVIPWIGERWNVAPSCIGLSGNSMGGQGALQLAYRFAREFPVVAALSPAVDFHNWYGRGLPLDDMFSSAEQARQETATLNLHPLNWPKHQFFVCDPTDADWFEGCERLASKLASMGIPFERDLETIAGGHSWEYFDAQAPAVIGFVAEKLRSLA
jgi:S-formylglutathione hydrolase FrmB